ncbi:MAG: hydroxymethylbilane synthase [Candidatus Hydrogenedentes bacterium]|nr:hydroxymethylbilane synthase [Candidatus Hydrogenedentota bacterium]
MDRTIRIGTRGSRLALQQTQWVVERLRKVKPGLQIETEIIRTVGDRVQDKPLDQLSVQGVFTKELDHALLDGVVDLVVHSLKDLPTVSTEGIAIAAIPEREDARDAFIGKRGVRLAELPKGASVGTSSLRRRAQLLAIRSDLRPTEIRGNIDTRLRKLELSDQNSAIILAAAGLRRIELQNVITEYLDFDQWLPAAGQGALAIACRPDDTAAKRVAAALDNPEVRAAVTAERALLAKVEGGCHVPVGAYGRIVRGALVLDGLVAAIDGSQVVRRQIKGEPADAWQIGEQLGERLLAEGGADILESLEGQ